MIRGHRNLEKIDGVHQDQHRILFQNALGNMEKLTTTAPTADTLPIGYVQFANISGTRRLYVNLGGSIFYVNLTAA